MSSPETGDPGPTRPPPSHRARRALLRAGDHDTFSGLYADHRGEVFALAVRLTGDRALAEDVAAETFLTAWRRRESVEVDDQPLRAWLLAIAARQSMNVTRGLRRRRAFLRSGRAEPAVVPDFAEEAAGRLDDQVRLVRARRALGSLARVEQEVVALCVWSGVSYAEAAAALDIPIGTVRSRLHRARQRLRASVEQPDPDPYAGRDRRDRPDATPTTCPSGPTTSERGTR